MQRFLFCLGFFVSYWWIYMIKSLHHIATIWWHKSWSTLAQVMAWCLMAPSHYLNQCWLEDYWYPSQGNVTEKLHKIYAGKIYYFRLNIFTRGPFGLRVLSLPASVCVCVCLSVCQLLLVRTITRHPFKLGSPNLNQKMQNILLKVPIVLGAD